MKTRLTLLAIALVAALTACGVDPTPTLGDPGSTLAPTATPAPAATPTPTAVPPSWLTR